MRYFQIRGFAPPGLLEALSVPPRGPCSLCRAYREAFDARAVADDLARFELGLAQPTRSGLSAVVAVSGGKDSLSTLYLAKVSRDWKVGAYLFDNGFIPPEVVAQVRAVCDRLEVPLHVHALEGRARAAFAREVATVTAVSRTPCDTCAHTLNDGLAALCRRWGVRHVVFGTNFYASWLWHPSPVGFLPLGTDTLTTVNLPYALGVTAAQARRHVRRLGARVIDLRGVSTNCRVPEVVQRRVGRALGHAPELEVLSLEVMVGHLPRAAALRTLARKAPGG